MVKCKLSDRSNISNNLQWHTESKHKSKYEDLKKNMEIKNYLVQVFSVSRDWTLLWLGIALFRTLLHQLRFEVVMSLNTLEILELWEAIFQYLKVLENGDFCLKVLDIWKYVFSLKTDDFRIFKTFFHSYNHNLNICSGPKWRSWLHMCMLNLSPYQP